SNYFSDPNCKEVNIGLTPNAKSDNLSQPHRINATIDGRKRTNLVISYHYKKRNIEYLKGCKKRGVEPDKN
ncbi:11277_t:CDS:2, partial [Funneliformis geosporum]